MSDVLVAGVSDGPTPRPIVIGEDLERAGLLLVTPFWPARVWVDNYLLDQHLTGEFRCGSYDGETLRFVLLNGSATYRRLQRDDAMTLFDCVQASREVQP